MSKHDDALRRTYGITLRTVTDRLTRTFTSATASDIEAGAGWYPLANAIAGDLAKQCGLSKETCAAVISHLSPQQQWVRNVLGAEALLVHKEALPGMLSRSVENAERAISWGYDDLADSFGPKAKKTLRFYKNIMGDTECVTVDVWALRACGLDDEFIQRAGVYEAIERAYQLAARRAGVSPSTFQATCWVVARGGRAA